MFPEATWPNRDILYWLDRAEGAEAPKLTEAEQRAMDASAELANAMHALVADGPMHSHDWNEIAARIHDLQARIILHAAARFGWTRTLGGG